MRLRQKQPRARDPFIEELTVKLRQRREALHLSQGQVAEMLDCSQQFVSGIEQGREKITIDYLRRFASKTGCDFDLILRPPRQAHAEGTKVSEDYTELKTWIDQERRKALAIAKTGQLDKCLMEIVAYLPDAVVNAQRDAWNVAMGQSPDKTLKFRQDELRRAMEQSQVHSFGWPIGMVVSESERSEFAPKPFEDGLRSTILLHKIPDSTIGHFEPTGFSISLRRYLKTFGLRTGSLWIPASSERQRRCCASVGCVERSTQGPKRGW